MNGVRKYLPPFIGGADVTFSVAISDESGPMDFTGFTLSAEVVWNECTGLTLTVGDGLTVLDLAPDDPPPGALPDPQFEIALTEDQTDGIPIGRAAYVKFLAESPAGDVSVFGPLYLERSI